jgi:hypothetical protein
LSAKWDFTSSALNNYPDAFVVAAKVDQAAAPTGPQDIPWVFLERVAGDESVTGKLALQVFRTDTRLGQPPATVSPIVVNQKKKKKKNSEQDFLFFFFLKIKCTPDSPEIAVKYVSFYCKRFLFSFLLGYCNAYNFFFFDRVVRSNG